MKLLKTHSESASQKNGVDCLEHNFNYLQNIACVCVCVIKSVKRLTKHICVCLFILVSFFLLLNSVVVKIFDDKIVRSGVDADVLLLTEKFSHKMT